MKAYVSIQSPTDDDSWVLVDPENPNAEDEHGETALMRAVAPVDPLAPELKGDLGLVKALLDYFKERRFNVAEIVDYRTSKGSYAVFGPATDGDEAMCALLEKHGANLDRPSLTDGRTPRSYLSPDVLAQTKAAQRNFSATMEDLKRDDDFAARLRKLLLPRDPHAPKK